MSRREWRTRNGVQEARCSGCGEFKPANRDHYHLKRSESGKLIPLSHCKACRVSTEAADKREALAASTSPVVVEAQSAFLRMPARRRAVLPPAPLGFGLELRP